MSEIKLFRPFHPIDHESGELLPTTRTFVAEGIGFGTAEVFETDDSIFDAVKLTFVRPLDRENSDVDETIWEDPDNSSLAVVTTNELLLEALKTSFRRLQD